MKLSPAFLVVWMAIVAWAGVSSFHPEANDDVWFHLRVGTEVLENGVPHVERWSATAAGRPFIAHEWLAAVVFERIAHAGSGAALTLLRAWIAALIALSLWLSAGERRDRAITVWLACIVMLQVLPRMAIRPHLFSLLFVALVVVGIEGWRKTRGYGGLLLLIPLTGLWANLHGAFLLGPMLLLAAAAGALLDGLVRRGAADVAPFAPKDALPLLVTAALGLLAALVNPFGLELFAFSFEMATGNEYLKSIVNEWLPFYAAEHRGVYDAYLYPACVLGAWALVLLRRARHDVVDFALLAFVTFLSFRAFRFAPYFALVAFPIALRSLPALSSWPPRRLALAAGVAPLLLFAYTGWHGPGHRVDRTVPFGAGLIEHPASALVRRALTLELEGAVLNEYEDGGLLLYAAAPKLRPVMDGRIDIYGEQLVAEYIDALLLPDAAVRYVERYDVRFALLKRVRAPIIDALVSQQGFVLVAGDESRVLLARYSD